MKRTLSLLSPLLPLLVAGWFWPQPAQQAPAADLVLVPFFPESVREPVRVEGKLLVYSPREDVTLETLTVLCGDAVLHEAALDQRLEGDPEFGEINAMIERLPHELAHLHRHERYFAGDQSTYRGTEVMDRMVEIRERVEGMREAWERHGPGASPSQVEPAFAVHLDQVFAADDAHAELELRVRYRRRDGSLATAATRRSVRRLAPWPEVPATVSEATGPGVAIFRGDLHVHSCHGEAAGACAPSGNCTAETLQTSGSFSYAQLKSQFQALGIDWFTATDHSYCIDSDGEYDVISNEIAAINDPTFLVMPDIEVSSDEVGPQSGGDSGDLVCLGTTSSNHMGAHGLAQRIPGGGEGLLGFCDGLFSDVLAAFPDNIDDVRAQGGYAIAHHPAAGSFAWNSFALGQGLEADALHGVEIWNGSFQSGQGGNVGYWVDWLLGGRVLYAYSGSDTHDEAFDFGANHVLLVNQPFTIDSVESALKAGRNFVSNGPMLVFEVTHGGRTSLMGTRKPVPLGGVASSATARVHYDFGAATGTLTVFAGRVGDAAETVLCQSAALTGAGVFECPHTVETDARTWLRAYAETSDVSQTAYSNPVFFEPGIAAFESFCEGDGGDGAGCSDCPCMNNQVSGSSGGCLNGVGTGATLTASGTPSISGDTLRIELTSGNPLTFGVLASGDNRLPANPESPCFYLDSGVFATTLDGLRCVGGSFQRHGARPTDAGGDIGVTTNGWGPPDGPPGGLTAQGGFVGGQTRHFQVFYREDDTLACNTGQNTTQGITTTFVP